MVSYSQSDWLFLVVDFVSENNHCVNPIGCFYTMYKQGKHFSNNTSITPFE